MSVSLLVGTGLDATTNPNPNSLVVVNPYNGQMINGQVSPSWTSQGTKAFFPQSIRRKEVSSNEIDHTDRLQFEIYPSVTDATYTVNVWLYNKKKGSIWVQPAPSLQPTITYTGNAHDFCGLIDDIPIYFEFSDISSGTLELWISSQFVYAL